MPVLVTNADTALGTALVQRLLETGGEVRAWCSASGAVSPLRAMGAITAAGDIDDVGRLEAACEQVHTVIHLAGGLLTSSAARIVADAAAVAEASAAAGVRRIIALSVVGASGRAGDDLRRAKAETEALFSEGSVPSVIVRSALVLGGALDTVLIGTPLPADLRRHDVRLTPMKGLVDVLVALDDLRSSTTAGHAVMVAEGLPPMALGDVVDTLEGVGSYRPARDVPMLLPALAGPWSDDDPIAADAWQFTSVSPRPAESST